ncbi:uncharacterized protein G2W53_004269 [Senna tora]|uniref:Uncharacterized protein n=1 Tax=Senna tora TaxID=362788 RepID=A0A834XCU1_9FABA|nr:uncharacterized protein G2W53_004269 [Senna tora]
MSPEHRAKAAAVQSYSEQRFGCKETQDLRAENESGVEMKGNADTKDSINIITSISKTKEQQKEEAKGHSSMTENVVLDSLKAPHTSSLTRSISSR